MISIRLRAFRGCERADIECAPIALIAGENAAGKSSIAQATGAVLSGSVLPLAGLTKATAGLLVSIGAASRAASVVIEGESGTARIDWPGCETRAQGTPPAASVWAADLDSLAEQSPKERARVLGEYLHADPTREDLAQAIGSDAASVWERIERQGWEGAHYELREFGAELKGRWRQVTGATWGARVGASWRPDIDDDEDTSENDLLAALTRAKGARDKAIAAAAVSGAERERLQAELASLEQCKDILQQAEAEAEQIADELDAARAARAALPPGTVEVGMPCPHCGAFVIVRRVDLATTRLEAAGADAPLPAELKKRRLAIADADGAVSRLTAQSSEAGRNVERARLSMQSAAEARYHLDRLPPAGEGAGVDVDAAEREVAHAEGRLAGLRKKRAADALHQQIAANNTLLDILAPDGLRAAKLAQVLDAFTRTQLFPLTEAVDWAPVTVDAEMTLAYGDIPYALCSTSEQYRVRAVLAVAMARLDGSAMVVLDAADVLDALNRSALFGLLDEAGLPALVCMTLSRREQVPNLAALGLGRSYWLSEGVCEPLLGGQEAAA